MTGSDPISEAVVAGSAAGELGDAIQASRRKKRERYSAFEAPTPAGVCSNCATQLSGPVCHSCGQTADTYHRPIWELLTDILDGLFGLEGRLWRTLPALMFKPGKITQNYLSGVRARYVMPFRLYLTASVLFFLLVFAFDGIGGGSDAPETLDPDEVADLETGLSELDAQLAATGLSEEQRAAVTRNVEAGLEQAQTPPDVPPEVLAMQEQASRDDIKLTFRRALLPEEYPLEPGEVVATEDGPIAIGDGMMVDTNGLEDLPLSVRRELAERTDRIIDSEGATLAAEMQRWAPTMMFFMLPLYALMLAGMHFYKKGYFFYDHLVVSLHFHAFMFFLITGLSLAANIIPGWIAVFVGLGWSNWYLYRLHRTVYSHGRFTSLLRVGILDFAYLVLLSFGLLGLLIVAVMMS
ncbi:hypothetical protein AWH62_10955 [Maricaulis sp. W15]|uniref:Uncharacterized protein DUF3667 n=1 Tax=Maricaulis maris TaxID=74318 RepID=A0A495D0V5_9PROT|nr:MULTISPECIES: DUF3667 domain-containing protein [Maricaulis]OLF72342.1 hypothetical protein AWH62_10955 [Maricaulis sp. W15]RKQ95185.1 uncharacterized protein DUF3667 [Maricaulis maris]